MGLSCECPFMEFEDLDPGEWVYMYSSVDFRPLNTSKRKRCQSCNSLIDIGALCLEFPRYRSPYTDIEADIIGFDWNGEPPIKISSHYHCERCGEIFLNLEDAGYCMMPYDDMQESLKEYHGITGFKVIGENKISS